MFRPRNREELRELVVRRSQEELAARERDPTNEESDTEDENKSTKEEYQPRGGSNDDALLDPVCDIDMRHNVSLDPTGTDSPNSKLSPERLSESGSPDDVKLTKKPPLVPFKTSTLSLAQDGGSIKPVRNFSSEFSTHFQPIPLSLYAEKAGFVCDGWLEKKSLRTGFWYKRYFVLAESPKFFCVLLQYGKATESVWGTIPLELKRVTPIENIGTYYLFHFLLLELFSVLTQQITSVEINRIDKYQLKVKAVFD